MENNQEESKVFINLQEVPVKQKIKKGSKVFVLLGFVLCLVIGAFFGYRYREIMHPTIDSDVKNTFGEIESILKNKWLYENKYDNLQEQLENNAFYGMTTFDFDPYTTYMSKQEMDNFTSNINMDFVGIGVMYTLQGDMGLTKRVYINSPAEKAGMQAGDYFTHIDGKSIVGLTTDDIKEMVVGKEGTVVTLTIIRDGKTFDLPIVRGAVDNSVYCYVEDDYLVMELESFGMTTAKDIMSYVDAYPNIKKVVIDLRDNSGGFQASVCEIAGLFIGNGKTYLVQSDNKGESVEAKTECSKTYNFDKIVVLINGNTASAAEVFAICLREYLPNAIIVGETSFGKGVIQSNHTLNNGGALKYTSYYWYSPKGNSINGVGIVPDVEVKLDEVTYEHYVEMLDSEYYKLDSVSDVNRVVQKCLKYLDYDIDRTDGYFDESLLNALNKFKNDNNMNVDGILDKVTYETVISHLYLALADNYKDYQMDKAVELLHY